MTWVPISVGPGPSEAAAHENDKRAPNPLNPDPLKTCKHPHHALDVTFLQLKLKL